MRSLNLALLVLLAADSNPVRILKVSPAVCFAPCTMELRVHVDRDDRNEKLRVAVDGPNFYRYSEIALAPNSPTLFLLPYKDLPGGVYGIAVDVVRHDGHSWTAGRANERLTVRNPGDDSDIQ